MCGGGGGGGVFASCLIITFWLNLIFIVTIIDIISRGLLSPLAWEGRGGEGEGRGRGGGEEGEKWTSKGSSDWLSVLFLKSIHKTALHPVMKTSLDYPPEKNPEGSASRVFNVMTAQIVVI